MAAGRLAAHAFASSSTRRLTAFAAAALATSALIVGVVPALRAAQVDLVPRMAEGERSGQSRRTRWMSNLLVGTQMALAVMLVVAAVLLARTLANLHAVSTGFTVEQVVSARISPPQFRFRNAAARRDLYSQVLERAGAVPGVVSVAMTDRLPLAGEAYGSVFIIEGRPDPARTGDWPLADISGIVSPAFFSTLGDAAAVRADLHGRRYRNLAAGCRHQREPGPQVLAHGVAAGPALRIPRRRRPDCGRSSAWLRTSSGRA